MKIIITTLFLLMVLIAKAQVQGITVKAWELLEAKRAFVLGGDSVYATTQVNSTDTTLVTKDYLSSIGGGSGKETVTLTSHGLVVGDWIRKTATGYAKAQGNNAINADVVGVVDSVISANSFIYQYSGVYNKGSWIDGVPYFLSTTAPGSIVDTSQTYNVGDVYVFLGTGIDDGFLIEIDVGVIITEYTGEGGGGSTADTISSMYYSNDTLYVTESGNLWKAEIVGGSGGGATLYEKSLGNNETVVNTGILLDGNCIVWVNGEVIPSNSWSGEGTTSVNLSMGIYQYDNLIVYKSAIPISEMFEAELAENQTTVNLGFTPNGTTIIFFNGEALISDKWTALGTEITLQFPVSLYDKLIAKN